jgi:hypothetical protein
MADILVPPVCWLALADDRDALDFISMTGSAKPVTVIAALAGKSSPNISVRISVIRVV